MGRSFIAGINAEFRAFEQERGDAPILNDVYARLFLEDSWRVRGLRRFHRAIPSLNQMTYELQTVHCVRHRSVDALVQRALDQGFTQIVTLGAGYDTRPFRLSQPRPTRWIECDGGAVLERKAELLARGLERYPALGRASVTRVACDLSVDRLADLLAGARLDPSAPTLFVAEGLLHYLSREVCSQLFAQACAGFERNGFLFTFIRPEMIPQANAWLKRAFSFLSEMPSTPFDAHDLHELQRANRYAVLSTWDLEQQLRDFAPMARGRRIGVSQDVGLLLR